MEKIKQTKSANNEDIANKDNIKENENKNLGKKRKKPLCIIAITFLSLIAFIALILGGYIIYLSAQFYRIEDNYAVAISNNQSSLVETNTNYKISTYNIGFGAYSQDFSFFMDSGEMLDGTKIQGTGSRAKNLEAVNFNTNGAISTISNLNVDFAFFQEVDIKAQRSFKVNQYEAITSAFSGYSSSHTINFHSGYLFYPLTNPHGAVTSGIATLSKYKIESATRRSFPIDMGFFAKFFDLDRCFTINRLKINSSTKELVLINLHMSAYDEGGKIREKQLELLNSVLKAEYDKGNYVIAGGDFNHDIANSLNTFATTQKVPSWVYQLQQSSLAENFTFASSTNAPTCRSTDMAYTKNQNYSVVIDGFVVSNNVSVVNVNNIDTDFMFSDHNPVVMEFKLN